MLKKLQYGMDDVAAFGGFGPSGDLEVLATQSTGTDLFGRLSVALPYTIFDAQMQYDLQPFLFWTDTAGSGSVAHNTNGGSATLSVGPDVGARVVRQTRLHCPYEPGMMQLAEATGSWAEDDVYTRSRIGYFDDFNGCFMERGPAGQQLVSRSLVTGSIVDTEIPKHLWMGQGGLDDLDLTKSQILRIALQFLGVGSVLVGFSRSASLVLAHQINNDNTRRGAYWTTASLPVRYEIETVAPGGSGASMEQVCCSVKSEGGFDPEKGFSFSACNTSALSVTSTLRPLISIRPSLQFRGKQNRCGVLPSKFSAMVEGQNCELVMVQGGTLTGANWAHDFGANGESSVEVDEAATAISGGVAIDRQPAIAASRNTSAFSEEGVRGRRWLSTNIPADASETLTLCARSYTSSASVVGALKWNEVR